MYNRLAVDVASIDIKHIIKDKDGRYISDKNSRLNQCLTTSANIDQSGRAFIQDLCESMFDNGVVAVVPIDTNVNPKDGSFDISSMRTGEITQWYPDKIKMRVYNDKTGKKEELIMPKSVCAIIQNPFYSIMNEPNSTLQRLIKKLNILDVVDEQSGSGKLDLIIQLPYVVKNELRKQQAEERRQEIADQLANSKYGVAYTDGTERITQLNRAVENNLMNQIEYLTDMLYGQLGISADIINGTANEQTFLNYYTHTIEPIITAICEEMTRKFLSKTARTQGQSVYFFRDPFKLMPVSMIADTADKLTRNEIMTGNEVRSKMGLIASDDPSADELRNKNINQPEEAAEDYEESEEGSDESIGGYPISMLGG